MSKITPYIMVAALSLGIGFAVGAGLLGADNKRRDAAIASETALRVSAQQQLVESVAKASRLEEQLGRLSTAGHDSARASATSTGQSRVVVSAVGSTKAGLDGAIEILGGILDQSGLGRPSNKGPGSPGSKATE